MVKEINATTDKQLTCLPVCVTEMAAGGSNDQFQRIFYLLFIV